MTTSIYQNVRTDPQYKAATGLSRAAFEALYPWFAQYYEPKKRNPYTTSGSPVLTDKREALFNDTAAHFAAQSGITCLVLIMGENYGKFFPYPTELLSAPCRCLFPPTQEARLAQGNFEPPIKDPDIKQISVNRVFANATKLLVAFT